MWTLIRLLLEEQSDLGPHCLQKRLLKSQADDKADDNCCDWQFKGLRWEKYLTENPFYLELHNLIFSSICILRNAATSRKLFFITPDIRNKENINNFWLKKSFLLFSTKIC